MKVLKFAFSLAGVGILFVSFALAPTSSANDAYSSSSIMLSPGEMPSQTMIAKAYVDAEHYLEALEIEQLPEPEPEPIVVEEITVQGSASEENVIIEAPAPAPQPQFLGGGSPEVWMAAAGIAPADWGYVDFIAFKESSWNPNATNPTSGACGLIQAYPCSKVPGNGYDPVDNLRWADGYARDRYGSWKNAYEFWIQNWWW